MKLRSVLLVAAAIAAVGGEMWRRRSSSELSPTSTLPVVSRKANAGGDIESEDPGGSWADDGGSAPGKPGDTPAVLSVSPTMADDVQRTLR